MIKDVIHIGKYYYPDKGGIESVTKSISEGINGDQFRVSVLCFSRLCKDGSECINGVVVHRRLASLEILSQPLSKNYFFDAIRLCRSADIVHFHAPNVLGALAVNLISRSTPVIVHWHSDIVNKGFIACILKPIEYLMLRRSRVIVCTSWEYAKSSYQLKSYLNKVRVVPIGVEDVSQCQSASRARDLSLQSNFSRVRGRKIILSVGRLVKYKGFQNLIKAARLIHNDAVCVIVGKGPEYDQLVRLTLKEGVSDKVLILGELSHEDLHKLYSIAHLFCLPSIDRSEAFGVVIIEAFSYSLPVITTKIDGSGVPWVNQDSVTGYNVEVNSFEAISNACNRLLEDSSLRNLMATNARRRYETTFSNNCVIDEMLKIYKSI